MKRYAEVAWTTDDVHHIRTSREYSQWTDDQAEAWLSSNEKWMTNSMIERGWEILDDMIFDENEVK